ncbi:unnamed protein product [Mytilus coruscus]|uniref:C2H2-type domain-containing protein n=1 Tax=Mytilus coruscus TaxID=42192 RepID=A0A6J8EE41_MYTCO|nr:unnamed protein product [Mytilus coruscus]
MVFLICILLIGQIIAGNIMTQAENDFGSCSSEVELNIEKNEQNEETIYNLYCKSKKKPFDDSAEFTVDGFSREHILIIKNRCYDRKKKECSFDYCECDPTHNQFIVKLKIALLQIGQTFGCLIRLRNDATGNFLKIYTSNEFNGTDFTPDECNIKVLGTTTSISNTTSNVTIPTGQQFSQETQHSQDSQASEASVANNDRLGKLNEFLQACDTSLVKTIREPLGASTKKHAKEFGEWASVIKEKQTRGRVDDAKLEHFLDLIKSNHVIKDLPLGEKTLTLSSGEPIQTPYVIRCLAPATIVKQYARLCQEETFNAIGESTMYQILSECTAAVRKSVEGVDYYVDEAGEAFHDESEAHNEFAQPAPKRRKTSDHLFHCSNEDCDRSFRTMTSLDNHQLLGNCNVHVGKKLVDRGKRMETESETDAQKQYLSEKFNIGKVTGKKEYPAKVSRDMPHVLKDGHKRFTREQFLTTSQVASYFSRLALKDRRNTIQDQNDFEAAFTDKKLFALIKEILFHV